MSVAARDWERGAILIQVAVAMLALTGFLMFVVDYGILWVSRNQAQNSADAGALAGAIELAFSPGDRSAALISALSVSAANPVFGEQGETGVEFPGGSDECPTPGFDLPPACNGEQCVLVCVHRDDGHGNALRTWIGPILGVREQNVAAVATARARPANASRCLRPWAVADQSLTGTSLGLTDVGAPLTLTLTQSAQPGWFVQVDLTGDGALGYYQAIRSCVGSLQTLGDSLPLLPLAPSPQERFTVEALIDDDPGASWDSIRNRVTGSAFATSPRLVTLPVFDPATYDPSAPVRIVNMLGFFIEGVGPMHEVYGRIATKMELVANRAGTVPEEVAFVRAVELLR